MTHPSSLAIRPYRKEDAPALWTVYHSAIRETAARDYTAEQIAAWAPDTPDVDRWAARMDGIAPFVAERDGRIVGYADVQPTGYIDHFFVSGHANRQGVGSALMRQIHSQAEGAGIATLFSDVSITARPFFERWGFAVERAQQMTVRGASLTNFRMRKDLTAAPTQDDDPAVVIQRQLDAYNARDVDGWLATYAVDAVQFALHGDVLAQGHEQLRARITTRFAEPDLHARLLSRTVMGHIVVDLEEVTRNFPEGLGTIDMLCVYEVADGRIQKASFAFGAPRLGGRP